MLVCLTAFARGDEENCKNRTTHQNQEIRKHYKDANYSQSMVDCIINDLNCSSLNDIRDKYNFDNRLQRDESPKEENLFAATEKNCEKAIENMNIVCIVGSVVILIAVIATICIYFCCK